MRDGLERSLTRWLRAVAPDGWADSVLGDLREDAGGERLPLRPLLALAVRFTLESLRSRRPRRPSFRQRPEGSLMFVTDVRHALRALLKNPGFTLVAVVTLALAIGVNTAIYSALKSLVLEPLPFRDGDRLVLMFHANPQMGGILIAPPRKAIDRWTQVSHVFEQIEGIVTDSRVVMDGGEPEEIQVSRIRPTLLDMVGVRPRIGRPLIEADTASGAAPVALISHSLWRQRFGGDPGAVGGRITLGDTPHTIVGVLPERFALPQGSDAVWVADRGVPEPNRSESALAKLRPGVTVVEAQRALDGLATDADEDLKGWSGQLMSPADYNGSQIRVALYVLAGAVGLLLLIACANVASLVLSRNSARRRELAVRHAIGASRWQLVRHLFAESLIVAAAGGAAGLLIGRWCLSAMIALRPHNLEVLDRVYLDGSALAFAGSVSVAAAILFGIAPAVAASRVNLQEVLKAGGWSLTGSGLGVRKLLAIAQIAIALVLAVGAGLLLRSYVKLSAVDPGFDPSGVLSVRISLPGDRYPVKNKEGRHAFFEEVLSQVQALPGVSSAAVGSGVPPDMGIMVGTLAIEGHASTGQQSSIFSGGYVSPAYFSTLRIPLIEGRAFTDDDTLGRERVVVVGRAMAERHWPGASPLGARLRLARTGEWATVVGVAADVNGNSLASAAQHPQLYFPRAQMQPGFGAVVVRAGGDPRALIPAIKTVVWAIDPKLPLTSIVTADQLMARATSQARFSLALLAAFAACGVALVMVGVYGVMALFVGQRQRELGIRVALGASRSAVARLVLRQAGVVLVAGLAAGTAGAALLAGYLQTLLFQIPPRDAVTFVSAAAAIALAATCATLIPLRRATGTDPAAVLRAD